MQNLDEAVVKTLNPLRVRNLNRASNLYSEASMSAKNQIDKYGVSGVMNSYNPHLTLFYVCPAKKTIQNIPRIIKDTKYENISYKASKIAIGKLG